MSRETVMQPLLEHLNQAVAGRQVVNGRELLLDLQRDLARDAAEQVFMEDCTDPLVSQEETQAASARALWVLTTSMGETSRKFGIPQAETQSFVAAGVEGFHERLNELCAAGHIAETRQ